MSFALCVAGAAVAIGTNWDFVQLALDQLQATAATPVFNGCY
jgi:hypothetical protein